MPIPYWTLALLLGVITFVAGVLAGWFPKPPRMTTRRLLLYSILVVLAAVVIGQILTAIGDSRVNEPPTGRGRSSASASEDPSSPRADSRSGETAAPVPTPPELIRREAKGVVLEIAPGGLDLDTTSPDWGGNEPSGQDVWLFYQSLQASNLPGAGLDKVNSISFERCSQVSGHDFRLTPNGTVPGVKLCARTTEGRYAGLVVRDANVKAGDLQRIVLDIVVWEVV